MHILWRRSQSRRPLQLAAAVALSHAVFLAAYRQVTVELTGTPGGRLYWPALRTDGRTAQRLARAGHRRYSGGVLLSILTFHNCRLPKNSIRLPAQHDGRSSGLELWQPEVHSSKLGRDTDKTVWRSSLLLWISSGIRTRFTAVGLRMFRHKTFKMSAVQVATLFTGLAHWI
jgi:hypothetical protein